MLGLNSNFKGTSKTAREIKTSIIYITNKRFPSIGGSYINIMVCPFRYYK